MNKFRKLAVKMFGKVYGASNKKILVWSFVFLLGPFTISYLCEGLINLSSFISDFFYLNVGGWLVNTPLFSPASLKITIALPAIITWPIDRIVDLISSPAADFTMLALFPVAAILGATLLVKTKGQSLAGLFVASMGLVLSYAFLFMA